MTTYLTFFVICLSFHWSYASRAPYGPIISGGGGSCVKRDDNGKIQKAVTFDLWETQILYDYEFDDNYLRQTEWINQSLQRLPVSTRTTIAKELEAVVEGIKLVSSLQPVDDVKSPLLPCDQGYQYEQLGFYLGHGKVLVHRDIWQTLKVRDRVAFLLHEAIYRVYRKQAQHIDSLRTRRTVGQLMRKNFKGRPLVRRNYPYVCDWQTDQNLKTTVYLRREGSDLFLSWSWMFGSIVLGDSEDQVPLPPIAPYNQANWLPTQSLEKSQSLQEQLSSLTMWEGQTVPTFTKTHSLVFQGGGGDSSKTRLSFLWSQYTGEILAGLYLRSEPTWNERFASEGYLRCRMNPSQF